VRTRLEQSIDNAGLRPALAQLQATGSLFDVRFRSVPFEAWLEWLDVAARDTRLRVVDLAVTRESAPGVVTARVSLEMPRAQAR
jgi:general secretion pathway protein M